MQELLFELGCEEFPASFVRRAFEQLEQEIVSRLDSAGVTHGPSRSMGTPRRFIVQVLGVSDNQPDQVKEQRGPGLKAAYDNEGKPTKALEGFCRSQGIEPRDLRTEGDYVWVTKTTPGRSTAELLAEILPESVKALTFDKSMRWGSARMRFARPIRWMLASFGGKCVPFEIESVASGLNSRGHRFNFPTPFEATTFDQLVGELRKKDVEPDPAEREKLIRNGAAKVCTGNPILTDELVDENVFLTEWPVALEGEFPPAYLDLPEPVLITAMAKHERFFPVRSADGKLLNKFVSIRNAGVDSDVRGGNQWVLNARFNDAKFFFDEDAKSNLADFLTKTERMSFQEKLGTVRARAQRLAALAKTVAEHTGADTIDTQLAFDAGLYAKADLSTGLVSELPSLQGMVGGEYARREGFHAAVCYAVSTHYDLSKNPAPSNQFERTAVRVTIADQLDKLAGYLGLGLAPSGSKDPFGLRRAASVLIEAAWSWPTPIGGYEPLLVAASAEYATQGVVLNADDAVKSARDIFASRYGAMMPDARYDLLDAALLPGEELLNPRGVRLRLAALTMASSDVEFVQTATRPLNIVSAADKKGIAFSRNDALTALDRAALDSAEGNALVLALEASLPALSKALDSEDVSGMLAALKTLEAPINAFFDTTMVMAEDEKVRAARLTLLQAACDQLLCAGDFSKIVVEG